MCVCICKYMLYRCIIYTIPYIDILYIYLSIYLSIHLSIYLSIYVRCMYVCINIIYNGDGGDASAVTRSNGSSFMFMPLSLLLAITC